MSLSLGKISKMVTSFVLDASSQSANPSQVYFSSYFNYLLIKDIKHFTWRIEESISKNKNYSNPTPTKIVNMLMYFLPFFSIVKMILLLRNDPSSIVQIADLS
jgi:hypothetical protein